MRSLLSSAIVLLGGAAAVHAQNSSLSAQISAFSSSGIVPNIVPVYQPSYALLSHLLC